jgi:membrane-associated phospholipid phosphatase
VVPPLNELFLSINDFAVNTPWLHSPMAAYAKYGILLFAVFIVIGWWIARRRDDEAMATALLVPVSAVGAVVAQQLVVALVSEPRPYDIYPNILVLVSKTTDPSFPSDHACVVGAVAAGLWFVDRRLATLATAAALLMAFARVYAGAHWILDVVAGLALGACVAVMVILVLRRWVARLVHYLRGTRLRPLLATATPAVSAGALPTPQG